MGYAHNIQMNSKTTGARVCKNYCPRKHITKEILFPTTRLTPLLPNATD
jgi:hypothetical protein